MPDLDMGDDVTTWLNITYPPTASVPEKTRVTLDFDEVALQFQTQCSGMFRDTSVSIGQIKGALAKAFFDGKEPTPEQQAEIDSMPDNMPASGLFVAVAYMLDGKPVPPEVPDYFLILKVAERVMRAPPDSSMMAKSKALWFFVEQTMRRMVAKKDMPSLPESPAATPA